MKRLKKKLIDILEKELISIQRDRHFAVFRDDFTFHLVYDDYKVKWCIIKTNIGFLVRNNYVPLYNLYSITSSILREFIELVKNEKIKK